MLIDGIIFVLRIRRSRSRLKGSGMSLGTSKNQSLWQVEEAEKAEEKESTAVKMG
ncbi:hypothetical protein HCG51_17495 [Tolypothrix sp. PCC 7910]|uniref:hypothetical protein n=1 Tax=Tolypothrix sp. PCC 7910 TaxID=2099387 RepID=UPI0014278A29|nr:hypothetical protein [Tolypothrix sp. PCC 7910]QIR35278.1 hypothetical protein HCG51_17495 [Tolypothrix sp. PCC 7910]